jgi:transcriptional antiterminator RfaH
MTSDSLLVSEKHSCWYVVHTKPCQEERAVNNLNAWGIGTLAPWLETRRTFGSRQPLFPSYVFASFNADRALHQVNLTRGVSYVVEFGGKPSPVDDDIIDSLRQRIDDCGVAHLEPQLRPGDEVMIQSGPLRSFLGVFQRQLTGRDRVRVLLTTVGFNAQVDVPLCDVTSVTGRERKAA